MYIARLDTFRAVAALLVVYHHYFSELLPPALRFDASFGVSFFFVLSGFLITGILLEDRGKSRGTALAQFYIRRSFRILPLYYFVLLFGLVLNVPGFWNSLPWSPLYLVNVGIMVHGFSYFANLAHFWTLAIEEQFYFLWPFVVLFTRRAWIVAAALVVASSLYRLGLFLVGTDFIYSLNILGTGDTLAIGALGAIACRKFGADRVERILRALLLVSAPAVICSILNPVYPILPTALFLSAGLTVGGLAFLWLIVLAEKDGADGSSWGGRILPAIGRISYGIYVWHFVMLWLDPMLQAYGWPTLLVRCACLVATFTASWLSYCLVEAPLRSLGRKLSTETSRMIFPILAKEAQTQKWLYLP